MKVIDDRLIVQRKSEEDYQRTSSGLFLGVNANQELSKGIVLGVGNRRVINGVAFPLEVQVGDEIVFGKRAGVEYAENGQTFVIIKESDVYLIVSRLEGELETTEVD